MPDLEDAIRYIVQVLRDHPGQAGNYGYELYVPNILRSYVQQVEGLRDRELEARLRPLSPDFMEASWELARRGILRPGIKMYQTQSTEDGSGGNGFSLTGHGREWIAAADDNAFIPSEPSRFARLIDRFRARFGEGFYQRAQEAAKCHFATAYLSSCVMSGAAAESILLQTAITKSGDEAATLTIYRSASGRRRIEMQICGQLPENLANQFRSMTELLNYWRDNAAHGVHSDMSEFEAYEALARLLRYAHFVDDNWAQLIRN